MEVAESKARKDIDDEDSLQPSALWYRPPTIVPNYGNTRKRNNVLPKSKIQHVLLHDNKNQKNILDSKVKYLANDFKRSSRISDLHKRSFLVRQSMKQVGLWHKGIEHVQLLPEVVVQLHCPGNSKETCMKSAAAKRQAVMKAELQAMFPDFIDEDASLKKSQAYRYQQGSKNRRFSRQVSVVSMSDINKFKVQSEAGETVSPVGPVREKTTVSTTGRVTGQHAGIHSLSPTQSYIYNRSKTAMPTIQGGLTRKFSTYNIMPRRELNTAGNNAFTYERATDDPRFKGLKKQLIAPEKPIDGFIQLSPCGPKVIQKYGASLYNPRELTQLLDKYNDISFMSTRRIRSAQRKEEHRQQRLLPASEAFVHSNEDDRDSLYSLGERSSSESLLQELQ